MTKATNTGTLKVVARPSFGCRSTDLRAPEERRRPCSADGLRSTDGRSGLDRARRLKRATGATVVLSATLAAGILTTTGPASASSAYGFDQPDAIASYGHEIFVANRASSTISVIDAGTSASLGTLEGRSYGFDQPVAMAGEGADIFVVNQANNSVTEFSAATHAPVRVMSGPRYGFARPVALAAAGDRLYVLGSAGSVTEVSVASGQPVARAAGAAYGFAGASSIAVAQGHVFVTNKASGSVSELDAVTLHPWHVVSKGANGAPAFAAPTAMAVLGSSVWVTNQAGKSLTELSAATGKVQRVVPQVSNFLPSPQAITQGGGMLFVASPPGASPMITQVLLSPKLAMPWMMCNNNGPYTFSNPAALLVNGPVLWVVNEGGAGGPAGNSVTEMYAWSGSLIRVLR